MGPSATGLPTDALEVRVQAAAINAALKVATDDLAQAVADKGITPEALLRHREHLANALTLSPGALGLSGSGHD